MSRADRSPADGWGWFGAPADEGVTAAATAAAFARCFSTTDGQVVLDALRAMTAGRALGPEASDAALRHLEGQRQLVLTIHSLIRRGLAGI